MAQRVLGTDMHLWLQRTGLDTAPWARRLLTGGQGTPVFDTGTYRDQIATGNPDRRPMFTRIDGDQVVWADGEREHADVILLATGYRSGVDHLAGLDGALEPGGAPRHRTGLSSAHRGWASSGWNGSARSPRPRCAVSAPTSATS